MCLGLVVLTTQLFFTRKVLLLNTAWFTASTQVSWTLRFLYCCSLCTCSTAHHLIPQHGAMANGARGIVPHWAALFFYHWCSCLLGRARFFKTNELSGAGAIVAYCEKRSNHDNGTATLCFHISSWHLVGGKHGLSQTQPTHLRLVLWVQSNKHLCVYGAGPGCGWAGDQLYR